MFVSPIIIPQTTQGFVITVDSEGYAMTGLTAKLLLQQMQNEQGQPSNPGLVTLTLTVVSGGLTATYTTTGTEFAAFSGPCTAQLKVYNGSGLLLYSLSKAGYVTLQPVLG